jgi:sortase A
VTPDPSAQEPRGLTPVTPLGPRRRDVGELQREVERLTAALQVAERRRATAELTLSGVARMSAAESAELRSRLAAFERARDEAAPTGRAGRAHRGRARRAVLFTCMLAGVLLATDGILTILWQEPITALKATREQATLREDLTELDARFAQPPSTDTPTATMRPPQTSAEARIQHSALALLHGRRSGQAMGRVDIPQLGLRTVFVETTDRVALTKGPGHYRGTVLPGLTGTVGLAGHRTTYLAPFRRINELRAGARIVLRMPYGVFTYAVTGSHITRPSDASSLRSFPGGRKLVLTACHPLFSAAKRIVVTAQLVRSATA